MLRRGVYYTPWEMCVPVGRFLLGGFRLVIGGKRYQAVVPKKLGGSFASCNIVISDLGGY